MSARGFSYRDVRCDGEQVGLDGIVAEALNDLGQEQGDALEGHAEADLDSEEAVGGRPAEDLKRLTQAEFLIHDGGRVDLDAVVGESLLVVVKEAGLGGAAGQVPEGEKREHDSAAALDDEEPAPGIVDAVGANAEHSEGKKATECVCDVTGSIEEREAAGELATAVKGRQVVNNEWEEGALRNA